MLELRVTSGARSGARERFDKPVVTIGRHPLSDVRFDPHGDLEVSTRHAELRAVNGGWTIHDQQSTNGTFVNGVRVEGERALAEGDVISLGARGPKLEVAFVSAGQPRRDTGARIAIAVQEQTRTMRRTAAVGGAAVIVLALAAGAMWQRQSKAREQLLLAEIARSESTSTALQRKVAELAPHDSAFARDLATRAAEHQAALQQGRATGTKGSAGNVELLRQRLRADAVVQQSLAQMNAVAVHDRNDAAVAMVASDLDGQFIAGTAFGIAKGGLMVTNRHVVRAESGNAARRLRVIFANTNEWLPAHVVRMDDASDLALIQLDVPGSYPVVAGVSRDGAQARVGSPVLSIGYPHAVDTPMEGSGMHVTARTSIAMGTVSKRLGDVLQMDSYAGHGSSGSPVFDAQSNVVGVVYGGAPESGGRIVYAVPAEKLAAFVGADAPGILR